MIAFAIARCAPTLDPARPAPVASATGREHGHHGGPPRVALGAAMVAARPSWCPLFGMQQCDKETHDMARLIFKEADPNDPIFRCSEIYIPFPRPVTPPTAKEGKPQTSPPLTEADACRSSEEHRGPDTTPP